jgi:hypothetical protein
MMEKSLEYLKSEHLIVKSPLDEKIYLVPSRSKGYLHNVKIYQNGNVKCDNFCPNFVNMKVLKSKIEIMI